MICPAVTVGYLSNRGPVIVLISSGMVVFLAAIYSGGRNKLPLLELLPLESCVTVEGRGEVSPNCSRGTPKISGRILELGFWDRGRVINLVGEKLPYVQEDGPEDEHDLPCFHIHEEVYPAAQCAVNGGDLFEVFAFDSCCGL